MARPLLVVLTASCFLALNASAVRSAEIHQAAQEGNLARVQEIIEADPAQLWALDDEAGLPIHSAAVGGSEEIIAFLLSRGAEVEAVDDYDDTPLLFAAYAGKLGALKLLCERGAKVNAASIIGQVPIHFAARSGLLEMVQCLVEHGADVNGADAFGRRALFFARTGGHEAVATYLTEHGAVDDFKVGEALTEELAPGLTQVTVPFAYRTNAVALASPDGFLLVDTGMNQAAAPIVTALESLGPGPVRTIINTHLHGDHNGANAGVDSTASVITLGDIEKLTAEGTLTASAVGMAGPSGKSLPASYALVFGGHPVRIIPVPGMHSDEDLLVVLPEWDVVCMGSLLISEAFPAIRAGTVDRYLDFLDTVIDVFPSQTRFVAGHGRLLDHAGLREYRRMVVESTAAVLAELAKGKSLDDVITTDPAAPWRRYGECPYLPYNNSKLWLKTICRGGGGQGGEDKED